MIRKEYFAKYDAFCSHIFDCACLRRKAHCNRRGSRLWKNCIGLHQKTFLKMAGGRMHTVPFRGGHDFVNRLFVNNEANVFID